MKTAKSDIIKIVYVKKILDIEEMRHDIKTIYSISNNGKVSICDYKIGIKKPLKKRKYEIDPTDFQELCTDLEDCIANEKLRDDVGTYLMPQSLINGRILYNIFHICLASS